MVFRTRRGCPVCGSRFAIYRTRDYSYETCASCHGVWIEYQPLQELMGEIQAGSALVVEEEANPEERLRTCPDCGARMAKAVIARVPVDACVGQKHGIWLDGTELRQVLERTGNSDPEPPEPPNRFRSLLDDFYRRSS